MNKLINYLGLLVVLAIIGIPNLSLAQVPVDSPGSPPFNPGAGTPGEEESGLSEEELDAQFCEDHPIWCDPDWVDPEARVKIPFRVRDLRRCRKNLVDCCNAHKNRCEYDPLTNEGFVGSRVEKKQLEEELLEARHAAQMLRVKFEEEWEASSGPFLPAPHQWYAYGCFLCLFILLGKEVLKHTSKETKGKSWFWLAFATAFVALFTLLRVQLWAEEVRPKLTEDYNAYMATYGELHEKLEDVNNWQDMAEYTTGLENWKETSKNLLDKSKEGLRRLANWASGEERFKEKMEEVNEREWPETWIVPHVEGFSMVENPKNVTALGKWYWGLFIMLGIIGFKHQWLRGLWEIRSDGFPDIKDYILTGPTEAVVASASLATTHQADADTLPAPGQADQPDTQGPTPVPQTPDMEAIQAALKALGLKVVPDDSSAPAAKPDPKPSPKPAAKPAPPESQTPAQPTKPKVVRNMCRSCGARNARSAKHCMRCNLPL